MVPQDVPQLQLAAAAGPSTTGWAERNEPLPLDQPDRKATSFVTSHFYLDDFAQSSEDPNPRPLQHTPLQAIPEEGFRTPAAATDEDVRLARRYQGYGGTRFVEDDLAGDPEAGALASNGQGPPSITDRLRSTADGAQAAADLIGAGAGLAAVQAFRSQLPQDAAEYVRLNVLPRPGPAQPPPQIIGRPSDVERLLGEAGQRAQEVERGAQAVEETAAVAAEEGEVAVAAEGVGGAFGYLGGLAEGAAALAPTAGEVAGTLVARPELARRQRRGWPWALRAAQPTASHAARAGCWRTRSSQPRPPFPAEQDNTTPKLTRLHSPQNTTPKLTRLHSPSQPRKLTGPPARLKTKTDEQTQLQS